MPMSSIIPLPPRSTLKAQSTQGRYMAWNCVPNQKGTMISGWLAHHTYRIEMTAGGPKKGSCRKNATNINTAHSTSTMYT